MAMPKREVIPLTSLNSHLMKDILSYNPLTGIFVWLRTRGGLAQAGSRAGTVSGDGYRHLRLMRQTFKEHRLAWFYVTGAWPVMDIDHIDGDKHNNAIANLRLATCAQNIANSDVRKDSKTKLRGVRKRNDCNRWAARITENGKRRFLGNFTTPEAAFAAYQQAARAHFGEFTRV